MTLHRSHQWLAPRTPAEGAVLDQALDALGWGPKLPPPLPAGARPPDASDPPAVHALWQHMLALLDRLAAEGHLS